MKIGVRMPYCGELAKPSNLVAFAKRAEELGYYSLFMSDHLVIPQNIASKYPYDESGFNEPDDTLELMTTLAYVANRTSRIKLMTGIMVVPYRPPLIAAKMLATIDYLSRGRLIVGAGAGWMREEFAALGLQFTERGELVDEYIRVCREVWAHDFPRFEGKYARFSEITFEPKPFQNPPPIWIGGESPRAIRRAAEFGDGWIPIGSNARYPLRNPGELQSALELLEQYVRAAGRNMSDLEIAYLAPRYRLLDDSERTETKLPFVGNAAKIISDINAYARIGVRFIGFEMLGNPLEDSLKALEEFASRVIPKLETS